jgi:hypothetical protein
MAGEYQQAVSAKQFAAQIATNHQVSAQSKTVMSQMSQAMAESRKGNKISFNK